MNTSGLDPNVRLLLARQRAAELHEAWRYANGPRLRPVDEPRRQSPQRRDPGFAPSILSTLRRVWLAARRRPAVSP
jgi:hypothetical protein